MRVVINSNSREFKENSTLLEILKELDLEEKVMAAAVNMNIVKQNQWGEFRVKEGDILELLDFVGGG